MKSGKKIAEQSTRRLGRFSWLTIRTATVVATAYLIATILSKPFSFSLGAVSAMSSADFCITDMYQLIANGREVRTLSPDIVIVDVNNCTRDQIAETVDLIRLCDPKAIGVDISFVEHREGDESLLSSLMGGVNWWLSRC